MSCGFLLLLPFALRDPPPPANARRVEALIFCTFHNLCEPVLEGFLSGSLPALR